MRHILPENPTNFEKLVHAIMEDNKQDYVSFSKEEKAINIFIEDWELKLYENGKWTIA